MSYEIVKAIKIDKVNKKVFLKSASSNVYPKHFTLWEATLLSEVLATQGIVELEKVILLEYYKGNMQKTNNNYEKSLSFLDKEKYNWDTVGFNWESNPDGGEPIQVARKYSYDELKEVLYQNYIAYCKREKGKFVIYCKPKELFVSRFVKNGCYLVPKENAKVFISKEDAELKLQNFDISKYEVMEVA